MFNQLRPGQQVNEKFGILSISQKTTTNGDPYLIIELTHPSGTITGKVWSDAIENVKVKEGGVAELKAIVDQYRGVNNFNIQHAYHLEDEELENYISEKPTMVFDIETVGLPFKNLDESQQNYLVNNLEKKFEGTKQQLHDRTGLYPLFGFVVAIGMYNPNTDKGAVYYTLPKNKNHKSAKQKSNKILNNKNKQFIYKQFDDEKELLLAFWKAVTKYDRYVTYNGSGFDFPFLVFRSGVHRIKVPFETHGSSDKFLDLSQKIRINHRAFQLEQLCKAFNIDNPKEDGVSGMEVAKLYRKREFDKIIRYVCRDVLSTAELFKLWKTYLAGKVIV